MSALNRTGGWNPGGGHYLELIDATDVAGYARPKPSSSPAVTLRSGKAWNRIYCTPGTIGFDLEQTETDNGDLYGVDIRGLYPYDDFDKNEALGAYLQNHRVLVRMRSLAGRTYLFGTPQEPLQLTYKFSSGDDVPDGHGYSIAIKGNLTWPPAYER